ncbi:MAG TPA: hypothetical protein VIM33_04945 [Gaiellaceae bacterium]
MKRGLATSEAQLSVLVILGQLVAAIQGALPAQYAGIGATVVTAVYALSRGFAKAGGAEAFPALAAEPTTVTTSPLAARKAELEAELAKLQTSSP